MSAVKEPASYDVFQRAEQAGKFRPLREEALRLDSPDSEVSALRHVASRVATLGLEQPSYERPEPEEPKGKTDRLPRHEQIVERISAAACEDDGYRVQLVDLAAVRGGVYRQALDRLYAIEVQTLGRWEAFARLLLDYRQLDETKQRDAEACHARPSGRARPRAEEPAR
jgi:hypothetical protein